MLTVINEREKMRERQNREREPTAWGITSEEDKGKKTKLMDIDMKG